MSFLEVSPVCVCCFVSCWIVVCGWLVWLWVGGSGLLFCVWGWFWWCCFELMFGLLPFLLVRICFVFVCLLVVSWLVVVGRLCVLICGFCLFVVLLILYCEFIQQFSLSILFYV